MPVQHKEFRRYTLHEYIAWLETFVGQVGFTGVHVHGTWKPTIADYRAASDKERLIQSMWRFHVGTRKFNDIAQHATIDPDGYIWEGRSLLLPPASATGFNDVDQDGRHPFMFEMIGNFDIGAEQLKTPQLDSAVGLTKAILDRWRLPAAAIKFHREMQPSKTCPGSAIDKSWFVGLVTSNEKDKLSERDANRIITTWLQPAWGTAKTKEEKDEIHRLANELRKASGQRIS